MNVKLVPLADHHQLFSAEDIEIWEVTRRPSKLHTQQLEPSAGDVLVRSWGPLPELGFTLRAASLSSVPLTVRVRQDIDGVIGGVLWPSAVIAARTILKADLAVWLKALGMEGEGGRDHRPMAVDVGAGCGLTSMALALAGYDVIATDKACLLPLLEMNLAAFRSEACSHSVELGIVKVAQLEWTKRDSGSGGAAEERESGRGSEDVRRVRELCSGRPNLVVCSDCLYSSASVEPLLEVLEQVGLLLVRARKV